MKKKQWTLTQEAFDSLLACLDQDRERAGEMYETIRRKLVKFFEWRHCRSPEDLADETLNRVTRRILEGEHVDDLPAYCYGVARLQHLELRKRPEFSPAALDEIDALPLFVPGGDRPDVKIECFNDCLDTLTARSREMLIRYYEEEGGAKSDNRRQLAEEMGIPLNALRIRVHRIRERLEACVGDCMRQNK